MSADASSAAAARAPDAAVLGCPVPGVCQRGPFRLERLRVSVLEGTKAYSAEVTAGAEAYWEAQLQLKPKLFDGPVWCLASWEPCPHEADPALQLSLQRSSYKYILYTHNSPEGLQLQPSARSGAVGIMALTETSDGLIVFGQRSSKLGAMPNYWHCVPAGQLDEPDAQKVIQKELKEELDLGWDVVEESQLLGIVSCGEEQGDKYEFACLLRLRVTAAELYERYTSAEDQAEHQALLFVEAPGAASAEARSRRVLGEPDVPVETLEAYVSSYLVTEVARRALLLLSDMRTGQ
ncbi:unnamed protein product [Prorocentrum cordatum]|uniref:Nudix hydrolase domain-containing protein n=1 Tax=Prorocentrum cordatum TaxID=2364126 RepID=A0ABN9XMJ5_9DINO|nr:unnamed protein product [Polarella glacialis]